MSDCICICIQQDQAYGELIADSIVLIDLNACLPLLVVHWVVMGPAGKFLLVNKSLVQEIASNIV